MSGHAQHQQQGTQLWVRHAGGAGWARSCGQQLLASARDTPAQPLTGTPCRCCGGSAAPCRLQPGVAGRGRHQHADGGLGGGGLGGGGAPCA